MTVLVFIEFLVGCDQGPGSSTELRSEHAEQTIATQQVSPLILDSIVSTAILSYYVPSSSLKRERTAIAVFFDPQGDGNLPLTKYRKIADRFGLTMVGSNVSKNGMTMEPIASHYEQVKAKLRTMFPDQKRPFVLAGFSGGAKVALALSLNDPSVEGVVVSGAMFDPGDQRPELPMAIMVGKGDFNGQSMLMSALKLGQQRGNVLFQLFKGGHEWPSSTEMSRSLIWTLQIHEAGEPTIVRTEFLRLADTLSSQKDTGLGEYLVLSCLTKVFTQEPEATKYRTRLQQVMHSERFRNDLAAVNHAIRTEEKKRQNYIGRFATKDMDWWKEEARRLRTLSEQHTEEGYEAQRILGFLGLYCYMAGQRALNTNDPRANRIVAVYLILEPDNPEAQRMNAELQ